MSFADRLAEAVRRKGTLCVGIDPRWQSLPSSIRQQHGDDHASAISTFCTRIHELCEPYAGVVKFQSAFFEQLGTAGFAIQRTLIQHARQMGYLVILDAKRGDIASTATAYAEAAFGPVWNADSLTVNPYLGADAVEPFITSARAASPPRGLFVLVRTSNPGGGLFQNLDCAGRPLYRHVGDAVAGWNDGGLGTCGYGDVGAVVGATNPRELRELREALPQVWFLVPGYGAQGGTAEDVKAAYRADGLGAIVSSSRGITFPFHPDDPDWEVKVTAAAKRAADELRP